MTIKSDNYALKALAEKVGMYAVRDEGPRVQDGTSYFHGIWNDSRFASGYVKADNPHLIGE